jgi:hypothetical protein
VGHFDTLGRFVPGTEGETGRTTLDFWMDLISMVTGLSLAATGAMLAFVLPPGSGRATVFGLTWRDWGSIHFCVATVFVAAVVAHVCRHWSWLWSTVHRLVGRERGADDGHLVAGVFLLVLLATVFVGGVNWASTQVIGIDEQGPGCKSDRGIVWAPPSRGSEAECNWSRPQRSMCARGRRPTAAAS